MVCDGVRWLFADLVLFVRLLVSLFVVVSFSRCHCCGIVGVCDSLSFVYQWLLSFFIIGYLSFFIIVCHCLLLLFVFRFLLLFDSVGCCLLLFGCLFVFGSPSVLRLLFSWFVREFVFFVCVLFVCSFVCLFVCLFVMLV